MRRVRLAIVGFGRLGRACADAISERHDAELIGVVRRADSCRPLEHPYRHAKVVTHLRELGPVDAVLACVPPGVANGVVRALLQERRAVVECAGVPLEARETYYEGLADYARRRRARALLGAGWDPGVLTLLERCFALLIPRGETLLTRRPAVSLHHTAAAEAVTGVRGALACEFRDTTGRMQRYIYVELVESAELRVVAAAIAADPAFAGEPTQVFTVPSIAALEEEAQGMLLERRGSAVSGAHQTILLEGRFDPATFAARVMVESACRLPELPVGGHRYALAR